MHKVLQVWFLDIFFILCNHSIRIDPVPLTGNLPWKNPTDNPPCGGRWSYSKPVASVHIKNLEKKKKKKKKTCFRSDMYASVPIKNLGKKQNKTKQNLF